MRSNPSSPESLQRRITKFINGSAAGLVQLLVAVAGRSTYARILDCATYTVPTFTSGLREAVVHLREMLNDPNMRAPTLFAHLYSSVQPVEERKRMGQFFTSADVATWALDIASPCPGDNVCDAGAGSGVFAEAIFRSGKPVSSYVGVEIDPILALCAAHVLDNLNAPTSYKVWYANFLLLDRTAFAAKQMEPPSVIIANPPFVRFHNLSNRALIRTALKSSLGIDLSSFSGAGGYFLSRAADLVGSASSDPGTCPRRLMFFFPTEASGAAHAQRLRDDLLHHHGWRHHKHTIPN